MTKSLAITGMKRAAVAVALLSMYSSAALAADTKHITKVENDEFANGVSDAELDQNRGQGATIYNWNDMQALLLDNSATNTTSGDNIIADNALAGMSGLATIIQNSGNNVIVQSSTIVNVTFDGANSNSNF